MKQVPGLEVDTQRKRILVVDDEKMMCQMLKLNLTSVGYDVTTATSGVEALSIVKTLKPDLVLSDIDMPDINGLVLLAQIKSFEADIEVVMVTGSHDIDTAISAVRQGASDYITKPFSIEQIVISVKRSLEKRRLILENRVYQYQLEELVSIRTSELEQKKREVEHLLHEIQKAYDQTLESLIAALDLRDNETKGHSRRVVDYAILIAREMHLSEDKLLSLYYGALLHDIGKIGIADAILHKPASLDRDEWTIMQTHSEKGYQMLKNIAFLEPALLVVRHHHERWDGMGYPLGLKGEAIPINARIFSIADSFDAMTTTRPYRQAMSIDKARREITLSSGFCYDPSIVEIFLSINTSNLESIYHLYHVP